MVEENIQRLLGEIYNDLDGYEVDDENSSGDNSSEDNSSGDNPER